MRQRSRPAVPDDAAVVENLLKLGGGSVALTGCQVCLSAYIDRIEARNIAAEQNCPQLGGVRDLQDIKGGSRVLCFERQLRLNRGQPQRLHLRVQWEALS